MAKDPAVLFYTSDFLSGTYTISNEQVGKYIRLLCFQHQKGILTEKDMLNICKTYDEDIYSKFVKTEEGYYNEKMHNETVRRKSYTESRKNNRLKPKNDNHMNNICETYDKHMETETETITENKIIDYKESFLEKIEPYKQLLNDSYEEFTAYWCEPSKSGKLRYQSEKFFDPKRRVNTWLQNKVKYGNTKNPDPTAASRKRMQDLQNWVNS
jgi:hypothetical protein